MWRAVKGTDYSEVSACSGGSQRTESDGDGKREKEEEKGGGGNGKANGYNNNNITIDLNSSTILYPIAKLASFSSPRLLVSPLPCHTIRPAVQYSTRATAIIP